MATKFRIRIPDHPRIAKVVAFVVRVTRRRNDPDGRKHTVIDYDLARAQGNPVIWELNLRRAANNPDVAGDDRVVANIVYLTVYDRHDKVVDRMVRRYLAPPTP